MELRTLKYFLTVAEELNITHAAKKLNISQPPLSRQLYQLEDELGVSLFIRGKKRIQLTEEGKFLAQQARNILKMAEQTTEQLIQIQQQTVKGKLSIGVTETCSASVLPAILPDFSTLYPQISFDIWCGNSNDICRRIENGMLDMGIVRKPVDLNNFEALYLKTEHWIAIVSKKHKLGQETAITMTQLGSEPLFIPSRRPLQDHIRSWFPAPLRDCHILGLYNQLASIIPLIIENMGIAIGPESVAEYTDDRLLSYLKITEPEQSTDLYMICASNRLLPVNARAFWDFIQKRYKTT